ncbi:putative transcription factor AP2-EREBP family [Helianthus annuus]|nr:putative transcription factor AP2-EREBP family [Helianthus annuus]
MSSVNDICKLFPAMTLENTSSSSSGNKLLKNKTTKKKEEALRKLSGGVNKKKKKKKEDDELEEWWKLGRQTSCSERKKRWKLLGVKKSGTTYFAAIIYPDGRLVRLGTYTSSKLAAMAYDQESLKIYHLQKPLNFPHRVIIGTPEPGWEGCSYTLPLVPPVLKCHVLHTPFEHPTTLSLSNFGGDIKIFFLIFMYQICFTPNKFKSNKGMPFVSDIIHGVLACLIMISSRVMYSLVMFI